MPHNITDKLFSPDELSSLVRSLDAEALQNLSKWCNDVFMNYECVIAKGSMQARFEEIMIAVFCMGMVIGHNAAIEGDAK